MQGHGTYSRYTIGCCRCAACKKANSEYEKMRVRNKAYGRFPWVDPVPSREHLQELLAEGCGVRSIARVSGISRSGLQKLLHGKPGPSGAKRPMTRIHAETEARLLAISAEEAMPPDTVPAAESWNQIEEIVGFGIPKSRIAEAMEKSRPALQLSKRKITPDNARAVAKLHWALWLHEVDFRSGCSCPLPSEITRRLEEDAA